MTDVKILELGNSPSLASGKQISLSGNCQQKICGALNELWGSQKAIEGAFKFWMGP